MPCYHPLKAWQLRDGSVVFSSAGSQRRELRLPCGQCIGCRLERSRQWAVRCVHEASMWECNCFITLTYSDEHLPRLLSLDYSHFQRFLKRLRRRFSSVRVRFFAAGEYGDDFGRPHFHALLFNFDFVDKYYWRMSPAGFKLYRSPVLESLWTFGNAEVGALTFESAAYVARYCVKKITGAAAASHYAVADTDTGELEFRTPEFCHMSLKPGIASNWLSRFRSDVYPHGRVVVNGVECIPPRYYDEQFKKWDVDGHSDLMLRRAAEFSPGSGTKRFAERLLVKEVVQKARIRSLKRSI